MRATLADTRAERNGASRNDFVSRTNGCAALRRVQISDTQNPTVPCSHRMSFAMPTNGTPAMIAFSVSRFSW